MIEIADTRGDSYCIDHTEVTGARASTSAGAPVGIDPARAAELFEGMSIEPWPMLGATVGAIYAWGYRDGTVGSYGEVGLGIQARRRGSRPSLVKLGLRMTEQEDQGIWVVNLPVTTESAYRAGVDLWGYPKYVTPITTRFEADRASVRLGDELELSIGALGGPTRALPVVTYTGKGGRLVRTVIEVGEPVRWGTARSANLELLGGDRPTARSVEALGLTRATKLLCAFRTDRFVATLPAGVDAGSLAG